MSELQPRHRGKYTIRQRGTHWVLSKVRVNASGELYESAIATFQTIETASDAVNWLEGRIPTP